MATDSLQFTYQSYRQPCSLAHCKYASPETNSVCSKESAKINYQRRMTFVLRPLAFQSNSKIITDCHAHRNTLHLFPDRFFFSVQKMNMTACLLKGKKYLCFTVISSPIHSASLFRSLQTEVSNLVSLKHKLRKSQEPRMACYKAIFLFYQSYQHSFAL